MIANSPPPHNERPWRWLLAVVANAALAWIVAPVAHAQAPDQTLFGPKQYLRVGTGAPNVYTVSCPHVRRVNSS